MESYLYIGESCERSKREGCRWSTRRKTAFLSSCCASRSKQAAPSLMTCVTTLSPFVMLLKRANTTKYSAKTAMLRKMTCFSSRWLPTTNFVYLFYLKLVGSRVGVNPELMDSRTLPGIPPAKIVKWRPKGDNTCKQGYRITYFSQVEFYVINVESRLTRKTCSLLIWKCMRWKNTENGLALNNKRACDMLSNMVLLWNISHKKAVCTQMKLISFEPPSTNENWT